MKWGSHVYKSHIYLEDSPDRIVDVLENAKQPMFLVCVTDQLRRFQPGKLYRGEM